MQHADRMKFKSQILEMFSTNAVTARVDGSKSRHVGGKEDSTRERGLTLIALVINQIVSALAGALVAAFLSPALFGAVHLSRTLVIFASTACSLGLDLGLQKQLSGRGSMPKKFAVVKAVRALAFGLSVLVIITSFVGGASFLEGKVFKHPDLAKALITTLLALPFLTDLTILGGAFRGLYRPLPSIVAQSLVQPVIRVLTIITCLVLGQEFLALPLAIVAGASLSWIILEIQSSQFFGSSKRIFATPLSAVREVLSYSTPLSLAIMTNMLTRMLDLLFIGYFRAPNELGKYSVVLLMTQMIGLAAVALGQTLGTRVAAAYIDADMQKIMKIQTAYMMQVAVISAPVFACLVFWGDRIDLLIFSGAHGDDKRTRLYARYDRLPKQGTWHRCCRFRHASYYMLGADTLVRSVRCSAIVDNYDCIHLVNPTVDYTSAFWNRSSHSKCLFAFHIGFCARIRRLPRSHIHG
jgi:O-antigen/teichoic acid export membrane protein